MPFPILICAWIDAIYDFLIIGIIGSIQLLKSYRRRSVTKHHEITSSHVQSDLLPVCLMLKPEHQITRTRSLTEVTTLASLMISGIGIRCINVFMWICFMFAYFIGIPYDLWIIYKIVMCCCRSIYVFILFSDRCQLDITILFNTDQILGMLLCIFSMIYLTYC